MKTQMMIKPKAETTTVSVRLPKKVEEDLLELADYTERSKSFLAAKAIEAYVAHELNICRMLQEGLDDVKAGRVVPHEQVMAELDEIINKHR